MRATRNTGSGLRLRARLGLVVLLVCITASRALLHLTDPLAPAPVSSPDPAELDVGGLEVGSPVTGLAFSPDGRRLALSSGSAVVVVDAANGREVRSLDHGQPAQRLAFSPSGHVLASASQQGAPTLWEVASGRRRRVLEHPGGALSVAFAPGGDLLATGGKDGLVRLWDVGEGQAVRALAHGEWVPALAFSPDGRLLAAGGVDGVVWVWQVADGAEVRRIEHGNAILGLAFSADGRRLAVGSTSRIVDVEADTPEAAACLFTMLCLVEGSVKLWELSSGRELAASGSGPWAWAIAFSADGHWVALGDWEGNVLLREVAPSPAARRDQTAPDRAPPRGGPTWSLGCLGVAPGQVVSALAFSPDGSLLAAGTLRGTVKLWQLGQGEGSPTHLWDAPIDSGPRGPRGGG